MESKSLTHKQELHGIHHAMTMRHEGMSMVLNNPSMKIERIEEDKQEDNSSWSGSFDPEKETPQYN